MTDLKSLILDRTNGGKDIIISLYPQSENCFGNNNKFKLRTEERTPSANCFLHNNIWYVKDFGSDFCKNAIDCFMYEKNISSFTEALECLASIYQIDYSLKRELNKADFSYAAADENAIDFSYIEKNLTYEEMELFIPFLKNKTNRDELYNKYLPAFQKYNWKSLKSYSRLIKDKKQIVTVSSNQHFPIYLRECGQFQKIYSPLSYDKAFRFFYNGNKPYNFVNGLKELETDYNSQPQDENGKVKKLPAAFFCSGERDALCCAAMGYYPLWLNSETGKIDEHTINHISQMVEKIYNIPDIDETGKKAGKLFAQKYMQIYTIWLPDELLTHKDNRGNPRKDLRDYLEYYTENDFKELIKTAEKAKFWELNPKTKKIEMSVTSILYFLYLNNFYRYKDPTSNEESIVNVNNNIVTKYEPSDVRHFIHNKIRDLKLGTDVEEAFLRSKSASNAIYFDLKLIDLNFQSYYIDKRYFAIQDKIYVVDKNGIHEVKPKDCNIFFWNNSVIDINFKRLEPSILYDQETKETKITKSDSILNKICQNTSRIYWKKELENSNFSDEENNEYEKIYDGCIFGPRLTDEERNEQKQLFINKCYWIGDMLYRYKIHNKAMAYWILENKVEVEGKRSGGSGKSFLVQGFYKLKLLNVTTIDGKDNTTTDNNHMLDRVTTQTDLIYIDDITKKCNFGAFYTLITGSCIVNPKRLASFEIPADKSPKITFSSNYPPQNADDSTLRRLICVPVSDYYHSKTDNNDYKKTRTIASSFNNKDIFGDYYTQDNFNADLNFYFDCLIFFYNMFEQNIICYPPMKEINNRINDSFMGELFLEWADQYFSDEENLNALIVRHDIYKNYCNSLRRFDKEKNITKFNESLKKYCLKKGYIYTPKDLQGYNSATQTIKKKCTYENIYKTYDMIYIQTPNTPLNNNVPDKYYK